jgi:hypothetical protein
VVDGGDGDAARRDDEDDHLHGPVGALHPDPRHQACTLPRSDHGPHGAGPGTRADADADADPDPDADADADADPDPDSDADADPDADSDPAVFRVVGAVADWNAPGSAGPVDRCEAIRRDDRLGRQPRHARSAVALDHQGAARGRPG